MSDEPEKKDDPAAELRQGLTHLWRAARGAAKGVQKEVERTDIGKAIDDASREFVRAAANVVDRIAHEVDTIAKPQKRDVERPPSEPPPPPTAKLEEEEDEFDGVRPKEKGPTPQDPGFRIAVDDKPAPHPVDDSEKKKPE
jgi:hypothetical protein